MRFGISTTAIVTFKVNYFAKGIITGRSKINTRPLTHCCRRTIAITIGITGVTNVIIFDRRKNYRVNQCTVYFKTTIYRKAIVVIFYHHTCLNIYIGSVGYDDLVSQHISNIGKASKRLLTDSTGNSQFC